MKLTLCFFAICGAPSICSGAEFDRADESLIYCPSPEAPVRTELKPGYVLLSYTVEADGSVSEIKVVESKPAGMWEHSAISALASWKYKASLAAREKEHRFTFEIAE